MVAPRQLYLAQVQQVPMRHRSIVLHRRWWIRYLRTPPDAALWRLASNLSVLTTTTELCKNLVWNGILPGLPNFWKN
jgi:hypothetical protein